MKTTTPTHPSLWALEADGSLVIDGMVCITPSAAKRDDAPTSVGVANCRMILTAINQMAVRTMWPNTTVSTTPTGKACLHLRSQETPTYAIFCSAETEEQAWATAAKWGYFLQKTGRLPSLTSPNQDTINAEIEALEAVRLRVPSFGKQAENNHGAIEAQVCVLRDGLSTSEINARWAGDEYVRDCALDAYLWMTGHTSNSDDVDGEEESLSASWACIAK